MLDLKFYKNKRVFITGHTGFKGSWLCKILKKAGADITGYSLRPETEQSLYNIAKIETGINSVYGDIRDFEALINAFEKAEPEIVFHLAAQPIVIEGYNNPAYTYETNVMGTVNILECIRKSKSVKSFVNVTTDKVYHNKEWEWGYRENEELNGYDPYSNSKSCSELITQTYQRSFFNTESLDKKVAISTVRAGNVIGGGDFSDNRIIPDCVRAAKSNKEIVVRNPYSIRPYQHVLDPLFTYLMIAQYQYVDFEYCGSYNVGPSENDCIATGDLVDYFVKQWGEGLTWTVNNNVEFHEANFLKLDCSKLKRKFNWKPVWGIDEAMRNVVEWYKCWIDNRDINECMDNQIKRFIKDSLL